MQNSLREQSGAASSQPELSLSEYSVVNYTSLDSPPYLPQMIDESSFGIDPVTMIDQGDSQDGTFRRVPGGLFYTDMDITQEEEAVTHSNPINIERKRGYTSSADIAYSSSPCIGGGLDESFNEQRGSLNQSGGSHLEQMMTRQRLRTLSNANDQQTVDYFPGAEPLSISPPDTFNGSPKRHRGDSKKLKGKPEQTEENLSPADRIIFAACLCTAIQCGVDENVCKKGKLSIGFEKPPSKKVRPSYNCEGSRGAIKTDDNGTVELNVKFSEPLQGEHTAVLIAGCITEESTKMTAGPHPHFKTSSVADQTWTERLVDEGPVVCVKKDISHTQSKIKLEVGIKRRDSNGERVSRLNRKCRIYYRLCIMQRVGNSSTEQDWRLIDWAQIVTSTINCEQPQGPPSMAELNRTECSIAGGIDLTCKGKNLESRAENPSVKVRFFHKQSRWSANADVYHNVTTPTSLCFKVPAFRMITEEERTLEYIPVSIEVTVDDRISDSSMDFHYKIDRQMMFNPQQDEFNDIINLMEVVQPGNFPMGSSQNTATPQYHDGVQPICITDQYMPPTTSSFGPVKTEGFQQQMCSWNHQAVKQEPNNAWQTVTNGQSSCVNNSNQLNTMGRVHSQTTWNNPSS